MWSGEREWDKPAVASPGLGALSATATSIPRQFHVHSMCIVAALPMRWCARTAYRSYATVLLRSVRHSMYQDRTRPTSNSTTSDGGKEIFKQKSAGEPDRLYTQRCKRRARHSGALYTCSKSGDNSSTIHGHSCGKPRGGSRRRDSAPWAPRNLGMGR